MSDQVIIKTVGYGTAASNIDAMGNTLHVIVHEWHSMYDGPIEVSVDVLESYTVDNDGKTHHDKIQSTQTIHATWMPSGSNRLTAPNIKVGERVEILQESDTSTYYWRPVGLDEHHRRLETIIWGIAATPDGDPTDPDSRYWIEFSSDSKKIVLTTSNKNGEKARYSISVDCGEGQFNIMDDRGNFATLDSTEDNWKMSTTQGSFIEIDKEDIYINAENNLEATIANDMSVQVGNNLSTTVGNDLSHQVGNNYSLSCTNYDVKASSAAKIDGGGSTISLSGAGAVMSGAGASIAAQSGGIDWSGNRFAGN